MFDIFAVSPTDIPTDTNRYPKAMTNLSGKPSGHKSFGLTHENPYLQPFLCRWCRHSTRNCKKTELDRRSRRAQHGQRMLANKIATYNHIQSRWWRKQLLFSVLLFYIRMTVPRNHLNKKLHVQVNCWGTCYCWIYTSMKDYQTLITDRGCPNLMMSFWGTVTFVRRSHESFLEPTPKKRGTSGDEP